MSFLTFTLSFPAYRPVPLVPSFESSHPVISMRPEEHSTTLDPLLDIASILSRIQTSLHYQVHRSCALKDFSISNLIQPVDGSFDLNFDVSHSLFVIRRRGNNIKPGELGYLQYYIVEPITSYVKQELKFKLIEAEHEARLQVFKSFETVPESRRVAVTLSS